MPATSSRPARRCSKQRNHDANEAPGRFRRRPQVNQEKGATIAVAPFASRESLQGYCPGSAHCRRTAAGWDADQCFKNPGAPTHADVRKTEERILMIRPFRRNDLSSVMQIWLDINIKAHSFISKHYWMDNYDMVKKILPQAEIYVYENNGTKEIEGFIGLTDNYIAGLFVKEDMQSKGIGKQLLNYAKGIKSNMYLRVYNKNIRAIQFYQREQFVVQSENTDDNTNEKELVMAWSR